MANLFQDSSGTTPVTADGQPVGLMLDKSQGLAEGTELVTNGDFSNGTTGWFFGAYQGGTPSATIVDGKLKLQNVGTSNAYASYSIELEAGKSYTAYVGIERNSSNTVVFRIGTGQAAGNLISVNIIPGSGDGTYGLFYTAISSQTVYITVSNGITADGVYTLFDNISVKELAGNHASQPVSAARPTYNTAPERLTLDKVDDSLEFTVPAGGWAGKMVLATDQGTASYGVSFAAGVNDFGGTYFPGNSINGAMIINSDVSEVMLSRIESDFVSQGATASYGAVTDFNNYWRNMGEITEFPLINTSSGTTFANAWYNNTLTSFPLLNTSSGTNFYAAWLGNNLTSFPLIDTSSGTNFNYAWSNNNLTSFPLIDTSSGTDFSYAWRDNDLTSFPLINTSSGTSFGNAWQNNDLTSFPLIDTSSGTDFSGAWNGNNLTSFPLIDTSSGTEFNSTWAYNNLTSFPLIDTSSGTNFRYAWYNNNLTSFPLIDTSSGTNFSQAWRDNTNLSTFPANMFNNCLATNFSDAFTNTNLSESSIDGILVSINSNGTSNGTFNQSGGNAPSSTGEAAITAMRSRGWTITVTGGF